MPVSGKEENGLIARQFSNCSVGVPIKKRKFPIFTPPSPPHQEQPSLGAENDLPQKEHSNRSQESSLSDVSVATNSSGFPGVNNNSFPVEREEGPADQIVNSVGNNAAFTRIKLEEPSLATCSGSVDSMDSKVKLVMTEGSVCQKVNTKLYLAPNEVLAPINVRGIPNKQKLEADWKPEFSTDSVNADLSLRLKEPVMVPLAAENSKHSSQIQEKLDPSFSLTVGRGEPSKKCNSNEFNSDDDTACLSTDRSNWDLNTTMDAWEGSVGLVDTTAGQGAVFDGLHVSGGTVDVKPSVSSAEIRRVAADMGKQILCVAERRTDFPLSSLCSEQQKSEDSLHLRLSMSSHLQQLSGSSSSKLVSSSQVPGSNMLGVLASFGSMDSVGSRNIKKEPLTENAKEDLAESSGNPIRSLDFRTVKGQMAERRNSEALKLSSTSPPKLVEHRPIKPEPAEDDQETRRKTETSHQADGKVVQCESNFSSMTTVPLISQKPCPPSLPKCSSELSTGVNTSNLAESSNNTVEVPINNVSPIEQCDSVDWVTSETVVRSVNHERVGLNASDGMIETSAAKNLNVENSETSGIKLMAELPPDSRGNGEGSISSDEKLNILTDMLEDVSYSSDYDSDGNHAVNPGDTEGRQLREDEEYEDGELREPLLQTASEGPILEVREAENVNSSECDIKHVDSGAPADGINAECGAVEKTKKHDHGQTSDDHIKECVDPVLNERVDQAVGEDDSLQESLTAKMLGTGSNDNMPLKTTQRKLLNLSGGKNVQKAPETTFSCVEATNSSQGPETTVGLAADKKIEETSNQEKGDSTLPKTDPSVNSNGPVKDANNGGKRGVIINLPRATNVSPCKTRSIPGRSLASRGERERYNDFEGEKFHPRGHRGEIYIGGPRKFIRDRMEEQSHRNPRLNFIRGRGRVSRRLDGPHGDWDSNNDFSPEIYNGPTEHRFSRHKRPPAAADDDAELDCSGYIVGGRKPLDDELPSFRHSSSRRHSPGGSEGLAARGVHIVHRLRRSISPTRCISGDGSENFGLRPGEKLMRGLQDDIVDPMFTRPQPPYNGVDRQFVRGNRNFYSVQRRGLPRMQSKSPIRSRSRSPGPLSSSRRRSPDGFNGLPELTHRRSPPIYRMERMRSSGRPCFPEDIMPRRQGSPPYMSRSNELREMESGRDHGHLRSVMPAGRSPSDRGLPRGTRRFDIIVPRERNNNDEYFGGPMHSGRFHKLSDDGNGDERRKCGERRPPVRSFRPPYSSGNRADPEFLERTNLREREFDGRIKNRSVNASRRTRGIEELEGNYRHGGQVWHDDGFDDVSRVKRKRFGH